LIREKDDSDPKKRLELILPGSETHVTIRELSQALTLLLNEVDSRNSERFKELFLKIEQNQEQAGQATELEGGSGGKQLEVAALRNNLIAIMLLTSLAIATGLSSLASSIAGMATMASILLWPMAVSIVGVAILYYSRVRMILESTR
jgi:hypothetical protein